MKIMRYLSFIVGIVIAETAVVYALYFFAGTSKSLYVIFSLAVIAAIVIYLIYGRYREEVKIKPEGDIRKKYFRRAFTIIIVICTLTACAILFTGTWLLALRICRG